MENNRIFIISHCPHEGCISCDAPCASPTFTKTTRVEGIKGITNLIINTLNEQDEHFYFLSLHELENWGELNLIDEFHMNGGCLSGCHGVEFEIDNKKYKIIKKDGEFILDPTIEVLYGNKQ